MVVRDPTGFRPNRSTTDTLHIIEEIINKTLNEKKYTLVACLDLEKAFDSANHEAIIIKAANLGINGKPLRWIENFLKYRTYQITIREGKSKKRKKRVYHRVHHSVQLYLTF